MHFSLDISDYKMSLREYYKYRYKSWLIASIVIFIFGILFLISSIVDYDVQELSAAISSFGITTILFVIIVHNQVILAKTANKLFSSYAKNDILEYDFTKEENAYKYVLTNNESTKNFKTSDIISRYYSKHFIFVTTKIFVITLPKNEEAINLLKKS